MKFMVSIKNPAGEVRTSPEGLDWKDSDTGTAAEHVVWQWTEGNFECDCNRALFFARAGDEPDADVPCSSGEPRFLVNLMDENGVMVYSEFEQDMGDAEQ